MLPQSKRLYFKVQRDFISRGTTLNLLAYNNEDIFSFSLGLYIMVSICISYSKGTCDYPNVVPFIDT